MGTETKEKEDMGYRFTGFMTKSCLNAWIGVNVIIGGISLVGDLMCSIGEYRTNKWSYEYLLEMPNQIKEVKLNLEKGNYIVAKKALDSLRNKDSGFSIAEDSINNVRIRSLGSKERVFGTKLKKFLNESSDITSSKKYRTSLDDSLFKENLIDALDDMQTNIENYDGPIDGKFHYKPTMSKEVMPIALGSIVLFSALEYYSRRKRKKEGEN